MLHAYLCLVTDTDAGVEEGEGVTQDEVFAIFAANVTRLRGCWNPGHWRAARFARVPVARMRWMA